MEKQKYIYEENFKFEIMSLPCIFPFKIQISFVTKNFDLQIFRKVLDLTFISDVNEKTLVITVEKKYAFCTIYTKE